MRLFSHTSVITTTEFPCLLRYLTPSFTFSLVLSPPQGSDCVFEHLSTPFHHGSILDMDLAYRRPFAVTCGADRSVAIWNHKAMTLDVYKQFQDDLHSVAIHPLGRTARRSG